MKSPRTLFIKIRATEAEFIYMRAKAKAYGMTISQMIREAVRRMKGGKANNL